VKCAACGGSGEVERGDRVEACPSCHGIGERQGLNFWDAEDEADRRREEKAHE
jgi:DnaJ-class molecular chaperone